ncbi:EAL domain-containing protein [Vibrio cyclitrophicus]
MKTIKQYNFEANEFVIELTETVLLSPTPEVKDALNYLREQGFTIALDDFGTGYSSLNYIHSYPIDCINRCCLYPKPVNQLDIRKRRLVDHSIGAKTAVSLVAEGVEEREQLDKIKLLVVTVSKATSILVHWSETIVSNINALSV